MKYEEITEKLNFSQKRYEDLCSLNFGDLPGANSSDKQMLAQEFFVHLVGSIDYLAQWINNVQSLGMDKDKVTISKICGKLDKNKPLYKVVSSLYCNPRDEPHLLEEKGYSFSNSQKGLIYRMWNYRNQVVHRGRQAFFTITPFVNDTVVKYGSHLVLDPRSEKFMASNRTVQEDLEEMLNLVRNKIEKVHDLINSQD